MRGSAEYMPSTSVATIDAEEARQVVEGISSEISASAVVVDNDVAKISIVGAGMLGNPVIASRMFGALSRADINIEIISTSEISISCLIKGGSVKDAVNRIHNEFFPEG